jgi:hypothetical protein
MSPVSLSRLWTGAGLLVLAGLWLSLAWRPAWAVYMGFAFLFAPYVLAAITLWLRAERDRLTMLCVAALVLLFLFAWFV